MKSVRLALFLVAATAAPATVHAQIPGVNIQGLQVPITFAPPAQPQVEQQPPQPGPGFLWVAGHWLWNGVRYIWNPGHWQQPPQQGHTWIPAQWTNYQGSYRYIPGHWRAPDQGPVPGLTQFLNITTAPPSPLAETPPPQPNPLQTWVPGQWSWNGSQYVWTPGHWAFAPFAGAHWTPGRWYSNDQDHHWFFHPGHW